MSSPVREKTFAIAITPNPRLPLPEVEKRGRPETPKAIPYNEKFFVSVRTHDPLLPRIEAQVWARDRQSAEARFLRTLSEPMFVSLDVD